MKHMTFNASCAFAGIANMLEAFDINKEDHEIALGMKLPYLFRYDDVSKTYQTGISLQGKELFNLYLNTLGIDFEEVFIPKHEVFRMLDTMDRATMIGILLESGQKHAVIFTQRRNDQYVFLNNRRQDSNEPEEYVYNQTELSDKLEERTAVGWLEPCLRKETDFDLHLNESLAVLLRYKDEIQNFCSILQPFEEIKSARDRLFRPLLLDGLTMMQLIGNEKMYLLQKDIQTKYLAAFRKQRAIKLEDEIPLEQIESVISGYMVLIKEQL